MAAGVEEPGERQLVCDAPTRMKHADQKESQCQASSLDDGGQFAAAEGADDCTTIEFR